MDFGILVLLCVAFNKVFFFIVFIVSLDAL